MKADCYLKLATMYGGLLKGEAKVEGHADEIEIYSWSVGASQKSSATGLSGQGMGRVSFHNFSFTTLVNKASAGISLACATGDPVVHATLSCRKSGGKQVDYLIWTLNEGMLTSYTLKGDPDSIPSETFTISFSDIEMEYKMQLPDGKLVAGGAMHFNVPGVAIV
jgi:type VI secretion system secreted protein Hcp